MFKKLFQFIWSVRRQFLKYFTTGVVAVILDMTTLYALKENFGLRPVVAVIINQIFILNFVFFINKYWSFQSNGMTTRQMFRFLIVALGNYSFAVIWMWLVSERLEVNYLIARILNIMLAVSWNFLLYRFFVYRPEIMPEKLPTVVPKISENEISESKFFG